MLRPPCSRFTDIAGVLMLGATWATAGEAPPPAPPAVVQPVPTFQAPQPPQSQPVPIHAPDPLAARRPHQVTEVIDAVNADVLSARLKALTEGGLFISSMTSVITENGKPVVIVVGMQQQLQPMRPPGFGQPNGAPGAGNPGPGPGVGQPGQLSQPGPLGTPLPPPQPAPGSPPPPPPR